MTSPTNRLTQLGETVIVKASKGLESAAIDNPSWSWSSAPADNLQKHMNLVMPLADKTAVGRAKAVQAIAANVDELFTGLNNVGTVHTARFDLIGSNLPSETLLMRSSTVCPTKGGSPTRHS